jgi:hypothetical protein
MIKSWNDFMKGVINELRIEKDNLKNDIKVIKEYRKDIEELRKNENYNSR